MSTPDTRILMLNQLEADLRREDSFELGLVSLILGERRPDMIVATIGPQQLRLDYSLETGSLSFQEHCLKWSMLESEDDSSYLLTQGLTPRLKAAVVREFDCFSDFSIRPCDRAEIRNRPSLNSHLGYEQIVWPFQMLEQSNVGSQLLKPRIGDYVDLKKLPPTVQPGETIAFANYAGNFQLSHAVVIRPASNEGVVLSSHESGVQYQGDRVMIRVSTEGSEHIRQVFASSRLHETAIASNRNSTLCVLGNVDFNALQLWCPVTYERDEHGVMQVRD